MGGSKTTIPGIIRIEVFCAAIVKELDSRHFRELAVAFAAGGLLPTA